jgi:hypothetical protein
VSASKRWSEGALEPAVAGDEANAEEREESRIGYGRPPVATRFRRGVSGNPRGRPKGARNIATVVAATLGERISITENGRRKADHQASPTSRIRSWKSGFYDFSGFVSR